MQDPIAGSNPCFRYVPWNKGKLTGAKPPLRPKHVWSTVDGADDGQVIEINWRATRIRDRSGDITVISNSNIAKSRVTNHSLPAKIHGSSINLDFDVESSADQIGKVLIPAVLKATHVLRNPPPEIGVQGIRGRSASYCVSFYVADFADIPSAQSDALKQVLLCVSNAGLQLARAQTEVFVVQESKPVTSAPSG